MWKNAWADTIPICGNHGDDISNGLELTRENGSIVYRCKGKKDGCICGNYMTVLEFEKMLNKIDELTGDIFNSTSLVGLKWKQGTHQFFIMDDTGEKLKVKVKTHKG